MISVKYFPFCPGIPWKTKFGLIIPEISQENWNDFVKNKETVVMAYGGLIESFFSQSIVQAINSVEPLKTVSWAGESIYKDIISAKYIDIPNVADNYPTPIFMDKENRVYFNALHNYINNQTYKLKRLSEHRNPILEQIFNNSLLPWNKKYIPKLNKFDYTKYKLWSKKENFFDNKHYILIIDKTIYSEHNINCLNFDNKTIIGFAGMMRRFGIPILYCSNKKIYGNPSIIMVPEDLQILFPLIEKCMVVLSHDIDYLLLSMMISKSTIICNKKNKKQYDIFANAEFLESQNMINVYNENLDVSELYSIIESLI